MTSTGRKRIARVGRSRPACCGLCWRRNSVYTRGQAAHDGLLRRRPCRQPQHRSAQGESMTTLLDVRNLKTRFYTQEGIVYAVNGISYHLDEGQTLGIVGESGGGQR